MFSQGFFHGNVNDQKIPIIHHSIHNTDLYMLQNLAMQAVTGREEFPLTLSWLSGQPPSDAHSNHGNTETVNATMETGTTSSMDNSAQAQVC